jgi:hypothetical protein
MQNFLKKHYSKVIIILLILFLIKNFQSCVRKSNLNKLEKNLTGQCDTLMIEKNIVINELKEENEILKDSIKFLTYEIRVAGIKVDEASKRADAVQSAVEKVKTNTTIKIENQKNNDE